MNWKKLISPKSKWEKNYDALVNSTIETMSETIIQLTKTIESQNQIIVDLNKKPNNNEKIVTEVEHIENPLNNEMREKIDELVKDNVNLQNKLNQSKEYWDKEGIIERYNQLLEFAFKNIDPFTNVDVIEAQQYYKNAIKKH